MRIYAAALPTTTDLRTTTCLPATTCVPTAATATSPSNHHCVVMVG